MRLLCSGERLPASGSRLVSGGVLLGARGVAAFIRYPRPRSRAIRLCGPIPMRNLDERQGEGCSVLANAHASPRELVGVAAYVELYTSRWASGMNSANGGTDEAE